MTDVFHFYVFVPKCFCEWKRKISEGSKSPPRQHGSVSITAAEICVYSSSFKQIFSWTFAKFFSSSWKFDISMNSALLNFTASRIHISWRRIKPGEHLVVQTELLCKCDKLKQMNQTTKSLWIQIVSILLWGWTASMDEEKDCMWFQNLWFRT